MLQPMVMVTARPETDEATIQAIMTSLAGLAGRSPGLLRWRCHRALPSDRPVADMFLLDSPLERLEAVPAYRQHPAHLATGRLLDAPMQRRAVGEDLE